MHCDDVMMRMMMMMMMWTNFNNNFTFVFLDEVQKNMMLVLRPHLKYVDILLREI